LSHTHTDWHALSGIILIVRKKSFNNLRSWNRSKFRDRNRKNFNRLLLLINSVWATPYHLLLLINSVWAIPLVIFMRIVRPIVHVRICALNAIRIGHFVPDVAEHLLINKSNSAKFLNLYFFLTPISNYQWSDMTRRSALHVFKGWLRYVYIWNRLIPRGISHEMPSSFSDSRDLRGLINEFDCSFPFTDEEVYECKSWLKSKGWEDGQPFVVLNVRDSKYLKNWIPNFDLDYHSYRNSDIESYLPSVEWLSNQGVWVVRMGRNMQHPLQSSSVLVIDYAFDDKKSDLLDIWLFANCSGCITTASGPDWISNVYRRPLLCVNASPLGILFSMFNSIWVPKNLQWEDSGESLNLGEYLDHTFLRTDEYTEAGIRIIDLTPEEILVAVKEFWQRIKGSWVETESDKGVQDRFWNHFSNWPLYSSYHGWKHPSSLIGTAWLTNKDPEFMTTKWVK